MKFLAFEPKPANFVGPDHSPDSNLLNLLTLSNLSSSTKIEPLLVLLVDTQKSLVAGTLASLEVVLILRPLIPPV